LLGPWPLDRRGFAGAAYSRASFHRLAAAGAREPASVVPEARLAAGYAECDVTARPGEPLAGYGKRNGAPCAGVHDRQRVRALALRAGGRRVVLIGGDYLLVTDGLADAVGRRLAAADGLDRSAIYFTASHTHSGPGGFGTSFMEWFWMGNEQPAVFVRLAEAMASAAHQALASLAPARWAYDSAPVPSLIRNRVRAGLPVDPELSVLSVQIAGGQPEVEVVVFGAHATILGPENRLASSDYPGFLATCLERRPGRRVIFCAGAVGSSTAAGLTGRRDFAGAQRYGERLGDEVEQVLGRLTYREDASLCSLYSPVQLGPVQFRLGPQLRASPVAAGLLVGKREGCIQALALDDLLFLGAPADINGELAQEVKAYARARGRRAVVTSFAGRYVGYLVPDRYYDTYADDETRLMSMFGPHNGSYFTTLLKATVEELSGAALPVRVGIPTKDGGRRTADGRRRTKDGIVPSSGCRPPSSVPPALPGGRQP
jgi:hypothetical protein